MFKEIPDLLGPAQIAELKSIAAGAKFVDGRISNPYAKMKQNLQLHDEAAYQKSSSLITQAMFGHEDFRNYAFPVAILPPLMTRYTPEMRYGPHADAAFLQLGNTALRSDLSCTIFLNDPDGYDGGALVVRLGDGQLSFKLQAGEVIIYPSDTFHEVEKVNRGERLVAITFIQSKIPDPFRRNLLFDLNEVAALEGLKMKQENFSRLQLVQANLLRYWADKP